MNYVNKAGQSLSIRQMNARRSILERLNDDRGEGVISMAIAVLIIAFLGVALWLVFKGVVDDTGEKLGEQVELIGDE